MTDAVQIPLQRLEVEALVRLISEGSDLLSSSEDLLLRSGVLPRLLESVNESATSSTASESTGDHRQDAGSGRGPDIAQRADRAEKRLREQLSTRSGGVSTRMKRMEQAYSGPDKSEAE